MIDPEHLPRPDCCKPGDITVTKIPTGYLIGRAIDQSGPGQWWQYICIVSTFREAFSLAQQFAGSEGGQPWFHRGAGDYSPLALDSDLDQ